MLTAVVHNVFETDQMESALPANGHKVHLTMSCGEQFGSIRLAYGGFALLQVCPPHQFALITVNVPHQMGRNFQILLVQKKTIIFLWVFSVSQLSTRVIPYFFLLFSCALVPEGTCTTWEAPLKGSVPRQIATCERYMRVQKTTLR